MKAASLTVFEVHFKFWRAKMRKDIFCSVGTGKSTIARPGIMSLHLPKRFKKIKTTIKNLEKVPPTYSFLSKSHASI